MFNNIETSQPGSFFVVWSEMEDLSLNDELFIVFLVDEKVTGLKELKLSHSKSNTFKEDWADVSLSCCEISNKIEEANVLQGGEMKPNSSTCEI